LLSIIIFAAVTMQNYIKILLTLTLIMFVFIALGQPAGGAPPGGPAGGTPGCWPPPCVPIDGGISFLIAIGAAFGGKKAYDSLKKK
jgi:hypothetical protein